MQAAEDADLPHKEILPSAGTYVLQRSAFRVDTQFELIKFVILLGCYNWFFTCLRL